MTYIKEVLTPQDLKKCYRDLARNFHPDKGGNVGIMQQINTEYAMWQEGFASRPKFIHDVQIGNMIFVNSSRAIVTEVNEKTFKAKSLETKREMYFDRHTGYAQLNLKFRAYINYDYPDILDNLN